MVEIEITALPPLTPAEHSVMNCHALLNLYRVVRDELALIGNELAGDPALLAGGMGECDARAERLRDPAAALHDAMKAHEFKATLQHEVETHLRSRRPLAGTRRLGSARDRLDSLLWILQVRAHEMLARTAAPQHWTQVAPEELQADFHELFRAMQENSRGRYRFVYNLALQQPTDYYIDLRFESERGTILLPPVVKDVLRDLIANARKYTTPGGQVRAALHASMEGVRITVEDTGCGIPADELRNVVNFGARGSNARGIRSLGAGCGLTKAFFVTHELGGRFWIASEVGRGTRIRLWIPRRANGNV